MLFPVLCMFCFISFCFILTDSKSYLINLIDSPGHIDFSSEVSTCLTQFPVVFLLKEHLYFPFCRSCHFWITCMTLNQHWNCQAGYIQFLFFSCYSGFNGCSFMWWYFDHCWCCGRSLSTGIEQQSLIQLMQVQVCGASNSLHLSSSFVHCFPDSCSPKTGMVRRHKAMSGAK
jgi:hypothetical protein